MLFLQEALEQVLASFQEKLFLNNFKIKWNKSFLQKKTVERFLKVVSSKDIIIMTNKDYKFLVFAELKNSGFNIPEKNIVLEPAIRNTAPAIALTFNYSS